MGEDSKLKPCPFCGSPGHLGNSITLSGKEKVYIFCLQEACDAHGPRRKTAQEATAAWNHRP
jgi:Lar family restriction alleviation protein